MAVLRGRTKWIVAGVLLLAGCSSAPVTYRSELLVDNNGMTLYKFDKDIANSGKSTCNGPCAKNWPPLLAGKDDKGGGQFSIIARDDGSLQWAHEGKPLYRWIKDTRPGDRTGDGFNKVWHAVSAPAREVSKGY